MSGWYIQEIAIEGFRGINNHGAPLELKFKTDHINSVFAPNGVGKSSIFDAVHYAVFDGIPKLDNLPHAEDGDAYYLNRFHPGAVGTVALVLVPAAGGAATKVTVSLDSAGTRTVHAPPGVDGGKILSDLLENCAMCRCRIWALAKPTMHSKGCLEGLHERATTFSGVHRGCRTHPGWAIVREP